MSDYISHGVLWVYIFELIGFSAYAVSIVHSIRAWAWKQTILFFVPCTFYGWFLEEMGAEVFHWYYYNRNYLVMVLNVPVAVACGWAAIIYISVRLVKQCNISLLKRMTIGALLGVSIDLGMDAVAYNYGLWIWTPPGIYFGVPVFNFVAWFLVIFFFIMEHELINRLKLWFGVRLLLSTASVIPCYGLVLAVLVVIDPLLPPGI